MVCLCAMVGLRLGSGPRVSLLGARALGIRMSPGPVLESEHLSHCAPGGGEPPRYLGQGAGREWATPLGCPEEMERAEQARPKAELGMQGSCDPRGRVAGVGVFYGSPFRSRAVDVWRSAFGGEGGMVRER